MPNKHSLKMLPQAQRDLESVYKYISIELKNEISALKLIDEIENALINLETMPLKYPLSHIYELANKGYRKCVIENYIALYKIDNKRSFVIVARVFLTKRDYKNIELY